MRTVVYIFAGILLLAGCIAIRPTPRIEFNAPDTYPEGIAYDKAAGVFYVSSARNGSVNKVTPEGVFNVLFADSNLKSTYGMKLHPDGKRLFVCVSDANYSKYSTPETRGKLARLIGIDVTTGKKVADIDLSGIVKGRHFINDLTFDDKQNMYVTDSYSNVIYKVTPDEKSSLFADSELFKTAGIGLNGIVWHPNGYLIVSNTGTGALYKVDVGNPANVKKVAMDQFFLNADGMLLNDSVTITLIQNGGTDKLYKLKSENNFDSATMIATTLVADRFTYPSTATMRGDETWVMNAKFHDLEDSTSIPSKIFAIQQAKFKPVPKPKNK